MPIDVIKFTNNIAASVYVKAIFKLLCEGLSQHPHFSEERLLPILVALAHEIEHITDAGVEFGQLRVEIQKRGVYLPSKFADIVTDGQGVVVKLFLPLPVFALNGGVMLALRVVGYDPEGRDIVFVGSNELLHAGKAGHGVNATGRHFSGHGVAGLVCVFKRQLSVGEVTIRLIKQALGLSGVHFHSFGSILLGWSLCRCCVTEAARPAKQAPRPSECTDDDRS